MTRRRAWRGSGSSAPRRESASRKVTLTAELDDEQRYRCQLVERLLADDGADAPACGSKDEVQMRDETW